MHIHPGVYNFTQVDMTWLDDGIDLEYEDAVHDLIEEYGSEDDIPDEAWAELEMISGTMFLYGDWHVNPEHSLWEVDKNGKHGYAILADSDTGTLQVLWSRTIRYGRPASPCYPCQVDAQNDDPYEPEGGQPLEVTVWRQMRGGPTKRAYPYYALPEELLYQEEGEDD